MNRRDVSKEIDFCPKARMNILSIGRKFCPMDFYEKYEWASLSVGRRVVEA
jgi:hypothetical protein